MRILIGGCGALGSQIAWHLAGSGREFVLVDDDVVEEVNLPTTAYFGFHCGQNKAVALAEMLFRRFECRAEPMIVTFERGHPVIDMLNVKDGAFDLVVDAFDNVAARKLLCMRYPPTVHVGVSESRTGAVTWDERYTVPEGPERGNNLVCTHDLGRKILRFTAVVAAGIVDDFLATGRKRDVVTTEDMRVL